jgi:hypothetical protein
VEHWLVDQISLLMVRIQRAGEIEKDCVDHLLRQIEEKAETHQMMEILYSVPGPKKPAGPAKLTTESIRKLNESVGRYETALENKLYRALHELERQQRRRQGEHVPAPAAGDLNIHGPAGAGPAAETSRDANQAWIDEL